MTAECWLKISKLIIHSCKSILNIFYSSIALIDTSIAKRSEYDQTYLLSVNVTVTIPIAPRYIADIITASSYRKLISSIIAFQDIFTERSSDRSCHWYWSFVIFREKANNHFFKLFFFKLLNLLNTLQKVKHLRLLISSIIHITCSHAKYLKTMYH